MPNAELGNLVAIYNSTLDDGSNAVNAGDVKLENENNVTNNAEPSSNTTEFNNWLSDILFIQMSALYNYVEVYDCYNYSNSCDSNENENDDFVGFAQQDPFFVNNPDDPWRLKKFLSPDSYYTTGLVVGLGDGLIEAADTVYTLVKFSVKSNPLNLMAAIITDFEGSIQQTQDKLEMVKDLINLIHDPVMRAQIVNTIESEMVNWYDQVMGNKTWAEMGYQHGKLLVEVAGAVVGIAEVKILLKTGHFSAAALSAIRKLDGIFALGNKLKKVEGVSTLIDDVGRVIAKGDENVMRFLKVKGMAKGSRPNPNTYLEADYISQHLSKFDGGVTKIAANAPTSSVGPPTGGTFVLPKSQADNLIAQAAGNPRKLEELLGLDSGILGNSPVRLDINNPTGLRMPDGNEFGANTNWIPGGKTSGGILEATVDQIPLNEIVVNSIF